MLGVVTLEHPRSGMRLFSIWVFSLKLRESRRLADYSSVIGAMASMYGMLCIDYSTVRHLTCNVGD